MIRYLSVLFIDGYFPLSGQIVTQATVFYAVYADCSILVKTCAEDKQRRETGNSPSGIPPSADAKTVFQAGLRTHEWKISRFAPSHVKTQWHVAKSDSFTVAGAVPGLYVLLCTTHRLPVSSPGLKS